jgi:dinuclear metal center YbgI/SA1388 family protein
VAALLIAGLEAVLEKLAPRGLAEPGDNCGLLVGDRLARVKRVLVSLELTEPVLAEAAAGGYDTVLTHHPLLFAPLTSVVESRPRERMVRELIRGRMNLLAHHTNLDSAEHGLAAVAADALGLEDVTPLRRSSAGWYKFVGFVPAEAVEKVAAAVFEAGAGGIGEYQDCAFAAEGRGWFTPGPETHPAVGRLSIPERAPELRWETVVPRNRVAAAVTAYLSAHPYEEPAFDIYPVEDVLPRTGLGRKGSLSCETTVAELAGRTTTLFELDGCSWSGDGGRVVRKLGVLPGSGRGLLGEAAGLDVLVTGDLGYHDAERADELGCALINAPHGQLEWWCLRRWTETLRAELAGSEVEVVTSKAWRSPWSTAAGGGQGPGGGAAEAAIAGSTAVDAVLADSAAANLGPSGDAVAVGESARRLRLRVDGGSRGNPGPGAIGAVLEDAEGRVLDTVSRVIGVCTNNVAEYRALLAGLEIAQKAGAEELEVLADSELLVKQVRGEYKVKSEGLKPLHAEALVRLRQFRRVSVRHVRREENAGADRLVNKALDEATPTSL